MPKDSAWKEVFKDEVIVINGRKYKLDDIIVPERGAGDVDHISAAFRPVDSDDDNDIIVFEMKMSATFLFAKHFVSMMNVWDAFMSSLKDTEKKVQNDVGSFFEKLRKASESFMDELTKDKKGDK